MKVKAISRSDEDYKRSRPTDLHKVQRNYDPSLHPFEKAREFKRALNAVKLDKMFAKPFITALSGHSDGVYCLAKSLTDLQLMVSGAGDGELKVWKLNERKSVLSVVGHSGAVKGLTILPNTGQVISVGVDKLAKIWSTTNLNSSDSTVPIPNQVYQGSTSFTSVTHHRNSTQFATTGSVVELWDVSRSQPTLKFDWGSDTFIASKFNLTETNVLATTSLDRSVVLYDLRQRSPTAKTILQFKSNAICWNPTVAFNFVVANEDHNLYKFDMRHLTKPVMTYFDHVSAVMDVDFDPTGTRLVSASYDRTIRTFNFNETKSKDVYHTKRMQRVFSVKFTMDSNYIVSGSDDTNLRLWKTNASDRLGVRNNRERTALNYADALKRKYAQVPSIKKVANHKILPKAISSTTNLKKIMLQSRQVKEQNRFNNRKIHVNPLLNPDGTLKPQEKKKKNKKVAKVELEKMKSFKDKVVLRTEQ